jgi:signal peptidase II
MQGAGGASLNSDADISETSGRRRIGVLVVVASVIVLLDQATKIMAVELLGDGRVVPIVDGIFQLRLIRNPGAAFGLGVNFTVVLAVIVMVVIGVILRMTRRLTSLPWAVALGAMLGGAVGNLIDRLFREPGPMRGHVVDFLELQHWPVFNIADSAVVVGAVLIAFLSLRGVTHDGSGPRPATGGRE